ncbi:MAG: ATP-binding protein [Bacteroidota bacterium]
MAPKSTLIRGNILVLVAIISALSVGALYLVYTQFEETRRESRQTYLEQNLQKAVIEFEKGIDKYAVLVSGLRSHVLGLGKVPTAEQIQAYVAHHLELIEYGNSIIINYIDSNHIFIFTVSERDLVPNDLIGVNLNDIRPQETILRMDLLLQSDGLLSFPPINLYEGFVGFPIDFRVVLNEEVVGYMTPLIDIRNLLNPIITSDINEEFTYRFSFGDEVLFDREQVYNGTKVHHNRKDHANLHLPKENYLIQAVDCYDLQFNIGIAYRDNTSSNSFLPFIRTILAIVLVLLLVSLLLFYFSLQNRTITKELRASNEELSFMNSFLKKFIYASSHDLQQPLVNIDNFQGLLKEKYGDKIDEAGRKYFNIISNSIGHMKLILRDLLIYSEIIKGGKEKEQIDLNRVVQDIIETVIADHIEIHCTQLPKALGNKSEIHRLFQNLISNAVKFNDKDRVRIQISHEDKGQLLELRVRDNGIGVSDEHISIIFEEFQQVNKYEYKGTGLGLSICKEIVRNHGGSIWVERNELGGADFVFQLRKND